MTTHKHIDKLCAAALALTLVLTAVLLCMPAVPSSDPVIMDYTDRLFRTDRVHTIDILIDDWNGFLETALSEQYSLCSAVIDGETFGSIGIRAKGNTSLSTVASMDSDRYSFKLEFDQYEKGRTYYGLDKLSLNNLIQDATCMKDYLTYRLMAEFGAAAPLCSYVFLTVNGEPWGLYLAVEAIEESFLQRNYGSDYGELYKPDTMELGGGRGNGKDFAAQQAAQPTPPDGRMEPADFGAMPSHDRTGSSGTTLQYVDDDPDSYAVIFDSAKTNPSDADKARLIEALRQLSANENLEEVLDVEAVLRYFVVHNYVVNGDSYTGSMVHNYYLYEEDGRLTMLPWDYNLAFGTFQSSDAGSAVNDRIDSPLSVTGAGDRPMADWIFRSDTYTGLYHSYFAQFLQTVDVSAIIDHAAALIAPYVEADPTAFYTPAEFQAGVDALKEFCRLRSQSIQNQLSSTGETVDASHLNLADMGTMHTGSSMPELGSKPNRSTQPSGAMPGKAFRQQPLPQENFRTEQSRFYIPLLLPVSCLVLLFGILFALRFRRRP